MGVGVITNLLKSHGYSVRTLTEKLWTEKGLNVSYDTVAAYCRASDESYGKPEVWLAIKEYLSDMKVEWKP